jgi:hypothetical protein
MEGFGMKLEFYKCGMLTVIAALLGFMAWKVQTDRHLVWVRGGDIDVQTVRGTVDVDVTNSIRIDQPVDVTGTVAIDR